MKVLILFCTTLAFSYELISFSKGKLDQQGATRLENLIEENYDYLPKCHRKSVFTKIKNPNIQKDSLRILNEEGHEFIVKDKTLLSVEGDIRADKLTESTFKGIRRLLKMSPSFKKLFRKLSQSSKIVRIKIRKRGLNRAAANVKKDRSDICNILSSSILSSRKDGPVHEGVYLRCGNNFEIGSHADAFWGVNNYSQRDMNLIALAHELYHAYDITRGLLDQRTVVDSVISRTEVAEIRGVYFENMVRADFGYAYRDSYGDRGTLLKNGRPIWIKEPCIKRKGLFKRIFNL